MVNTYMNCNAICNEKFCDSLCHYGFKMRQYRDWIKEQKKGSVAFDLDARDLGLEAGQEITWELDKDSKGKFLKVRKA